MAKQKANPDDPAVFAEFGKIVKLMITFEPASVASYNLMQSPADSLDEEFPYFEANDKFRLQSLIPVAPSTDPAWTQFKTFNGVITFIRGVLEGSKFAPPGSKLALCLDS